MPWGRPPGQLDVVFSDSAQSGGYLELQASEDRSFGLVHAFAIGGDDIIFGNCGHRLGANTQYWWRVRSVDMAGNTSDWSEPERYRTAAQCGCTSVPTPMSWLVLAPLALLAHRRRRTG